MLKNITNSHVKELEVSSSSVVSLHPSLAISSNTIRNTELTLSTSGSCSTSEPTPIVGSCTEAAGTSTECAAQCCADAPEAFQVKDENYFEEDKAGCRSVANVH